MESEKPHRSLRFKAFIVVVVFIIFAGVFWFYILPILISYESLRLSGVEGWTVNSEGEIRQTTFVLWNNGTQDVTIRRVWVNGTLLDSDEWGSYWGGSN
ncbi:MAG: hypothetical protein OEY24_06265 [Candidatus Bathyarchaeota archaeon]|nr:hypothetical protein [Candidatus Bathyarchaeota archaeon]MDH5495290.1 hypothetical protein [Candidatus Bathyarchaeota archaeon]